MGRLVIFGCGGFGREVLRLARQSRADVVFASDDTNGPVLGTEVIGPGEIVGDDEMSIAIGAPSDRRRISQRFPGIEPATIKAATAIVGDDVALGEGSILCDFAIVTASARIGRHFHGNIYSYVAHDCTIGDFVTFAPRVCCNGGVTIGDGVYIGTNASIRQGIAIGENAVIGMGAVVVKDVPAGTTVAGNPARALTKNG